MTATRQGPRLTVVGTCDGCEFFRRRTPAAHSLKLCVAESGFRNIGRGYVSTPAWCPLLPAARAALGLELVAESSEPHGAGEGSEHG